MSTTISSESWDVRQIVSGVQHAREIANCNDSLVVALHPHVDEILREDVDGLDGADHVVSILGVPVVVTEKSPGCCVLDLGNRNLYN